MSRLLDEALAKLNDAYQAILAAATADDLTPLGNAIALRRAGVTVGAPRPAPNVVVFGDLNRFKALNDQFGHETGDAAIAYVGTLIDTLIVKSLNCQAFRRSGDEFVILTDDNGLDDLQAKVSSFKECRFRFNGARYGTSMSFGAASTDGSADFHQLLERAELACQKAKSEGDGRMVLWTPALQSDALRNIRSRCSSCNARIACEISTSAANGQLELVVCPVCRHELPSA